MTCFEACYAKTTVRIPTAVMAFMACFMTYCVRLGFNMAILSMTYPQNLAKGGAECQPDAPEEANDTAEVPDHGPRYDWSPFVQGHLKAAYGYGYFAAHFPAGVLAERLGPRRLVLWSVAVQGALTAFVPVACLLHWGAVFALRLLVGLGGGVIYPSLHSLVAQWSPPQEKGKFIFALMGGTFASVVAMPMAGLISETVDWRAVHYLASAACALFCGVWLLVVHNSPAVHPAISEKERAYILGSLGATVKVEKARVPLQRVVTSVPFWALVALHYGNLWGLFLLTTDVPNFLNEVLGFTITQSGGINALPVLGRCIMSLISGSVVDVIVKKELWKDKGKMRKTLVIFSHIMPGALMLGLAFVGCDVPGAVSLLTLGLTFNGASTVTNLVNHHDLAPNYAGSLYGFMNGIGTSTLFIVPSIDGWLIKDHNGLAEWRIIFLIGSGFYLTSAVIFFFFGAGNIQSWNDPETDQQEEAKE